MRSSVSQEIHNSFIRKMVVHGHFSDLEFVPKNDSHLLGILSIAKALNTDDTFVKKYLVKAAIRDVKNIETFLEEGGKISYAEGAYSDLDEMSSERRQQPTEDFKH